jgi:hypothetical protein
MKSIRISDEAYDHATREAALMSRSISQQLEHWVRLGASLESSGMPAEQMRELLQTHPVIKPQELPALLLRAVEHIEELGEQTREVARDDLAAHALLKEVKRLLKKHYEMAYETLVPLAKARRVRLAQEIRTAELLELGAQ